MVNETTCYNHKPNASGNCTECGKRCYGTNAHVIAAFMGGNVTMDRNGNTREPRDLIRSGNGNLSSVREAAGFRRERTQGRTLLQSYGVTIAIKRDRDDAVFLNGHSYSPSTGRHQREAGASWRDGVSFAALEALLGPLWDETAHVVETAPQYCRSTFCKDARERAIEAWRAAQFQVKTGEHRRPAHGYEHSDECSDECRSEPTKWHDSGRAPFSTATPNRMVTVDDMETRWHDGIELPYPETECLYVDIERVPGYTRERMLDRDSDSFVDGTPSDIMDRGAHALTGSPDDPGSFALLDVIDPLTGTRASVICGFERGKADGRGDQLWAAICPRAVSSIPEALASLNPFAKGSVTDRGYRRDDTVEDVKRQGDLFFAPFRGSCPCPCHTARLQINDPDIEQAVKDRQAEQTAELRLAGILNNDGTIRRFHGCSVQGRNIPEACKRANCPPADAVRLDGLELPDQGGRHKARRAAMTANNARYAQGAIEHPQHKTLRLKTWHRVARSLATRAMSAAYRQPWGRGGGGYAD